LLYLFYITGKTYCWLFALVMHPPEQTTAMVRVTALLGTGLNVYLQTGKAGVKPDKMHGFVRKTMGH
jgi:hypothetical protein